MFHQLHRIIVLSALFALAGAAFVPSAGAYAPLTPAQVVDRLNAFRAANGFAGGVTLNADWSAKCTAHNAWMETNGVLSHPETPGTPGYSVGGNEAGMNSVLAVGPTWADGNPWLNAPIHLNQTLIPHLGFVGASEEHGRNCLTTWVGDLLTTPSPAKILTYPPNGGSMPYLQVAYETPPIPQTVGADPIPEGTPTGPHLMVFYDGAWLTKGSETAKPILTAATLTGPVGEVPVKVVSRRDSTLMYIVEGSAFVIPREPLVPNASYTLRGTVSGLGFSREFTRTFTTSDKRLCGSGIGGWYLDDACAGAGGTGPGGGISVRIGTPKSVSWRSARRAGVPISVQLAAGGKVSLSATAGKIVLGKATRTSTGAGITKVKLPLRRRAVAGLLQRRTGVKVKLVAKSGGATVVTTFVLRR